MSLINGITLIKGDSSDIYSFNSPDFTDFSDVNWTGTWTIRDKGLSGPVVKTGSLTKTPDNSAFVFRLLPDESNIPASKYFLSIEIANLVEGFRREVVQCALTIKPEGVDS